MVAKCLDSLSEPLISRKALRWTGRFCQGGEQASGWPLRGGHIQ